MARPRIAITKSTQGGAWSYRAFALAVRLGGGDPFAMTAAMKGEETRAHGVLFGGGDDIFPMIYDDEPKQGVFYDEGRDAMELEAGAKADAAGLAALGICRGAQMMNVMRGGALHADVSAEYDDANYPGGPWGRAFFRKEIETEEDSCIRRILGAAKTSVNSLHRQAVKRLGDGLSATACERNGVVQAIEDPSRDFFIGVQFHPELLIHRADMRAIFKALVDVAGRREAAPLR